MVFTNFLREENLKKFYHNATILAALKPYNKRNTKNFPGKLSDYLSTGNPVISTSVGSIPNILKNKESAFLVDKFTIYNIAETLKFILQNEDFAKKVGKVGQSIAKNEFDIKVVAKKLITHINVLQER